MKIKAILILIFFYLNILGQNNDEKFYEYFDFKEWPDSIIELANTAKNIDYLSDEEKKVIFIVNLVRMKPKLFANTILKKYINVNEIKENSYVSSLIKDLMSMKPLNPLYPNKGLYDCANYHAKYTGEKGIVGHQNSDMRFKKYAPNFDYTGENCHYGSNDPLNIVIDLLIDEGVPSLGHRKNILNSGFVYLGVSIQPHKTYEYTTVMCFGGSGLKPKQKSKSKNKKKNKKSKLSKFLKQLFTKNKKRR
jgi:hypothetical protein